MNSIPLMLYLAAGGAYAVHFSRRTSMSAQMATLVLVLGAFAHTFVIGMQTMEAGHIPFVGTTGAISMFVWLLALAYIYTEIATDERTMGVFIVPLMVVLQAIPAFGNTVATRPPVLESHWFELHVFSVLVAYASLALACIVSITYLLLFKELKAKTLGVFYARLPPLQVLDVMNRRAVTFGWIFLMIGLTVGAVWLAQVQPGTADPRVQAMSLLDPKIFTVLICWLVYTFAIFARRTIGWGGRRAAWLSLIGFAILLLNFVPIGYFGTETHNFY